MSKEFIKNALEIIGKEVEDTGDIRLLIYLATLQENEEKVSEYLQRTEESRDDYKIAKIIEILLDVDRPELARKASKAMLSDNGKLESLQKIASATKDGQDFQRLIDFIDTMTVDNFERERACKDAVERLVNTNKFVWARLLNKKYSCYQAETIIKAALKIKNYDEAVKAAFDEKDGDLLIKVIYDLIDNDQLEYVCKVADLIEERLTFEKYYYAAYAFAIIGFKSEKKDYLLKAREASLKNIKSARSRGTEIRKNNLLILATIGVLIEETQTVKTAVQEALELGWESQEILDCILFMLNEHRK